jgi:uncharacterized protein YjeT (DUF2065 family)
MDKLLFAVGAVAVFEGFCLALAPKRVLKVLEVLNGFSNTQLSRYGLIAMAFGISVLMFSGL